jgi:hypothetical protein
MQIVSHSDFNKLSSLGLVTASTLPLTVHISLQSRRRPCARDFQHQLISKVPTTSHGFRSYRVEAIQCTLSQSPTSGSTTRRSRLQTRFNRVRARGMTDSAVFGPSPCRAAFIILAALNSCSRSHARLVTTSPPGGPHSRTPPSFTNKSAAGSLHQRSVTHFDQTAPITNFLETMSPSTMSSLIEQPPAQLFASILRPELQQDHTYQTRYRKAHKFLVFEDVDYISSLVSRALSARQLALT